MLYKRKTIRSGGVWNRECCSKNIDPCTLVSIRYTVGSFYPIANAYVGNVLIGRDTGWEFGDFYRVKEVK